MGMTIKRKKDNRASKCILHRTADIPGGVSISVAQLGGLVLLEGTPIGKGNDGLYNVCKTAVVTGTRGTNEIKVAKGHHFLVGDVIFCVKPGEAEKKAAKITAIDPTGSDCDVFTLSVADAYMTAGEGDVVYEVTSEEVPIPKVAPIAIVGETKDIERGDNLFVPALVIGVIRESNAPKIPDTIKSLLKGVVYI